MFYNGGEEADAFSPFFILTIMITFDIDISADNKYLVITAAMDRKSPYYQDMTIKDITIDNQDTFVESGPSDNPLYYDLTYEDPGIEEDTWEIPAEVIAAKGGDITKDILYIYVGTHGTPQAETPCGLDNTTAMAIVFNMKDILNKSMSYMKEMEDECNPPKGFIDFILKLKAVKYALKSQNYTKANQYWKKFFKNVSIPVLNTKGCGCN